MKNTITEVKNALEGINSRLDEVEIESVIWKTREQKTPNRNSKKEKESKKSEDSLRELWDNIKHNNIHIIGVPEEKR